MLSCPAGPIRTDAKLIVGPGRAVPFLVRRRGCVVVIGVGVTYLWGMAGTGGALKKKGESAVGIAGGIEYLEASVSPEACESTE